MLFAMTVTQAAYILNLPPTLITSEPDIKKWYRQSARATHPDRGGTAEDFILVRQAYQLLIDNLNYSDDEEQIEAETADRSKPQSGYGVYTTPDAVREYFEARIQDLEEKLQREHNFRRQERQSLTQYEQTIYKHIRLIDATKHRLQDLIETWQNHRQFAYDNWSEETEKLELLHNMHGVNTVGFLAQKDALEDKKEQAIRDAEDVFRDDVVRLIDHTISTFYSLLDT